jgi:uncharacterized protein YecE (DUF72 family)
VTALEHGIRVGTAGWHYKDWEGIVYPENPEKTFKSLEFIASLFNTVEINSTFYKPANVHMGRAWVRKVAHNPCFKFTAKLWQRFTHERTPWTQADEDQVRQGMDPLMDANLLGALLIQFPWSFRNTEENREWLCRVIRAFSSYPQVIEVRHQSWDIEAAYKLFETMQVGFAAIDQPVIGSSIAFKPVHTGTIGYVRMHGRNYQNWFPKKNEKQSVFGRYDYLYTEEEIRLISRTVRTVAEGTRETYVIQNNHPRGQAVANAAQLMADLGEPIRNLPESLVKAFPELKKSGNEQD